MASPIGPFWHDERGAVAVTYALALTALVGIAGVGYDYSRMMTMDTELQSAADEAALAAASQLDGRAGAIVNAKKAVTDYFGNAASDVANRTVMSNDGNGSAIKGATMTFKFYTSFDAATDTYGPETTTDADAKVVRVTVGARKAFFAFTPIVGAINSGDMDASAAASLQGGTCKLPPLLICGPNGTPDFPTAADIGKGLLLKVDPGSQWTPGNFGYVDFGPGSNMVNQLLGSNSVSDSCVGGPSLTTEPGNKTGATDYLNTRFDVYPPNNSPPRTSDCAANGDYCPAKSTRKDLAIMEVYTFNTINQVGQPADPARPACGSAAPTKGSVSVSDWVSVPAASVPSGTEIGFPRDTGFSTGTIGNGVWNVSGYYASHPYLPAGMTHRWDIYKWERDNPASGLLQGALINTADSVQWSKSGACVNDPTKKCNWTASWTNYCSYPQPIKGTYHATVKDRRLMTVAVADCTSAGGGKQTLPVNKWMDIFLTEPSWDRTSPVTSRSEIYGEIVGVATKPDGSNAFQYYSRQKAVLLQ